jgi:hypothetical protein
MPIGGLDADRRPISVSGADRNLSAFGLPIGGLTQYRHLVHVGVVHVCVIIASTDVLSTWVL